jgi:hypothetical protein
MRSELAQQEGQGVRTATAGDAPGWGQDASTGMPWRASGGPPPEQDAFPVDWQLSTDEDEAATESQVSRDEEARMFQKRLLRLSRVYYPPPTGP